MRADVRRVRERDERFRARQLALAADGDAAPGEQTAATAVDRVDSYTERVWTIIEPG